MLGTIVPIKGQFKTGLSERDHHQKARASRGGEECAGKKRLLERGAQQTTRIFRCELGDLVKEMRKSARAVLFTRVFVTQATPPAARAGGKALSK